MFGRPRTFMVILFLLLTVLLILILIVEMIATEDLRRQERMSQTADSLCTICDPTKAEALRRAIGATETAKAWTRTPAPTQTLTVTPTPDTI